MFLYITYQITLIKSNNQPDRVIDVVTGGDYRYPLEKGLDEAQFEDEYKNI